MQYWTVGRTAIVIATCIPPPDDDHDDGDHDNEDHDDDDNDGDNGEPNGLRLLLEHCS